MIVLDRWISGSPGIQGVGKPGVTLGRKAYGLDPLRSR